MWRSSSNESTSGRSHQSCVRWPKTTPIRRASSIRCREGSSPATRIRARARHEDPGQHLDRRRLARAVRAEVADDRPALDRERDAVDGLDDRGARGGARPACAHDEALLDAVDLDQAQPRAPVVADGDPPDRRRRRARRARATSGEANWKRARQPERILLVEHVQRREVGDERDRDEEHDEAAQPARVDLDRVLRQEVAAVRERVRELARVDDPEGDRRDATQMAPKISAPATTASGSPATRPTSSRCRATTSA